jgi:hypothetical protein
MTSPPSVISVPPSALRRLGDAATMDFTSLRDRDASGIAQGVDAQRQSLIIRPAVERLMAAVLQGAVLSSSARVVRSGVAAVAARR